MCCHNYVVYRSAQPNGAQRHIAVNEMENIDDKLNRSLSFSQSLHFCVLHLRIEEAKTGGTFFTNNQSIKPFSIHYSAQANDQMVILQRLQLK